jgi:hypothetical protein
MCATTAPPAWVVCRVAVCIACLCQCRPALVFSLATSDSTVCPPGCCIHCSPLQPHNTHKSITSSGAFSAVRPHQLIPHATPCLGQRVRADTACPASLYIYLAAMTCLSAGPRHHCCLPQRGLAAVAAAAPLLVPLLGQDCSSSSSSTCRSHSSCTTHAPLAATLLLCIIMHSHHHRWQQRSFPWRYLARPMLQTTATGLMTLTMTLLAGRSCSASAMLMCCRLV